VAGSSSFIWPLVLNHGSDMFDIIVLAINTTGNTNAKRADSNQFKSSRGRTKIQTTKCCQLSACVDGTCSQKLVSLGAIKFDAILRDANCSTSTFQWVERLIDVTTDCADR
jgi:hypothetical protein